MFDEILVCRDSVMSTNQLDNGIWVLGEPVVQDGAIRDPRWLEFHRPTKGGRPAVAAVRFV